MSYDFAAAMRRALKHTLAQSPAKATAIIQAALARRPKSKWAQTATSQAAEPKQRQQRLTDGKAERGKPGGQAEPRKSATAEAKAGAVHKAYDRAPRLRKSLRDVLKALRYGRPAGLAGPLPGMGGTVPGARPPETVAGAHFIARSFSGEAGARQYKLYIPAALSDAPRGLIVMLHGCTQNPDDFAAGTNMNALAEAHGLLVAYPAQTRTDNAQSCWNWFRPGDQIRDAGEPAIIAGITNALMSEFGLQRHQVYMAGMSAGGAMAAIMGEVYPDLFAAVGIHSGLPYQSANDVISAFAAMRGDGDGPAYRSSPVESGKPVRTIVFHGSADSTVHPSNADRIVATTGAGAAERNRQVHGDTAGGRSYTRTIASSPDGNPAAEIWLIEGTGHAWSGGHPSGSYTDPDGPDASAEMVRFFLNAS